MDASALGEGQQQVCKQSSQKRVSLLPPPTVGAVEGSSRELLFGSTRGIRELLLLRTGRGV